MLQTPHYTSLIRQSEDHLVVFTYHSIDLYDYARGSSSTETYIVEVVVFSLLLGVALLSFLIVLSFYVVWSRFVGLDPTVAQRFVSLTKIKRFVMALLTGALLGTGVVIAPSVRVGVAGIVMLAASTFAALMLFELVQYRSAKES